MTERKHIYRCNVCGNIVEVLHAGGGELVCCGQPMELLAEKTTDAGKEKHVPVIERMDKKVKVKVGSVLHPMEENHYIEWIEIITDDEICRKFLKPGDAPEAVFEFEIAAEVEKVEAREFCTVHGLWQNCIEME